VEVPGRAAAARPFQASHPLIKQIQPNLKETKMSEVSTCKVQDYDPILEVLQRAGLGLAHIAGGAVRDTILGREIKDIDIFLPVVHTDAGAALLRSRFGYVKVGEWHQYLMFSDPMVEIVAKFEKADATIPICLIGLKDELTPQENVERFDFGVCMAFWTGGQLVTNDQFKRDAESKSFTLYRADDDIQFAYSMVRFKKLTADRYAGWTLSVPSEFEALAREHAFRKAWFEDGGHFGVRTGPQVLRPKER
jgi:hypothetical protein